jgi:4-amino-4-deoxy-L-arabinose transferase-like glycosyltransferase
MGRVERPALFFARTPHSLLATPSSLLLFDELRDAWRSESRDHRIALLSIAIIAIGLRVRYLGQPMRYDESVTYLFFVKQPWPDALSLYTYPNNHLFHTLLAKLSVTVFGSSPWALRLPAFLAGLLVLAATYAVARAIYNARAALFAAAIVASSGVMVLYSTNARGYSLVILAFLLLVLVAIRLQRGAPSAYWIHFAVIAAIGLWTIPVMLYPLAAVSVWIALSFLIDGKRAELRRLAIALGVAAGLTLLAYSPVISRGGIAAIIANKFVVPSNWFDFLEELQSVIRQVLASWSLGLPPIVSLALLWLAIVALRHHASLSQFRANIALAAFVSTAWLLVVNHRAPFPRVFLWLFPIAASLAGAGAMLLSQRRPRVDRFFLQRTPTIAITFTVAAATSVALSHAVLLTRDTGTFRDAEQASTLLRRVLQPGDLVLVALPANAPLAYYFDRLGVPSTYLSLDERSARRVVVIVNRGEGQTLASVIARSGVRDTARFAPTAILANLPASTIILFQRRDAQAK